MKRIFAGLVLLGTISFVFAQKKQKIHVDVVPHIHVDANLDEWSDWNDVANEGLWSYQLLQNKEYIFVAVRVSDSRLQQMAARNGIVFSVPPSKANKESTQLIYPFPDGEVRRALAQSSDPQNDSKRALIERSRGYSVHGFIGIPNGLLSLKNAYGIQAKSQIVGETFVYEAAIPKAAVQIPADGLVLKIAVNDGFSFLPKSTTRQVSARSTNKNNDGRATSTKGKMTLMVLLETSIK